MRQSPALFFLPDTPQNDTDTPNKNEEDPKNTVVKSTSKLARYTHRLRKQKTAYTTPSINFRHTIKKCLRFCST
ncbi:MAG: hypothetical protein IPL33_22145 [Sphingobacteriales bacterium]|nr:hypothetical protein [Sphingobacteriales bacterium]